MPRLDLNTARIAIGLHLTSPFRVWAAGMDHNRQTCPGRQVMAFDELLTTCKTYGVEYSRRHLYHILRQGNNLFWRYEAGRVTFAGQINVARGLTELALRTRPELVQSHLPGRAQHDAPLNGSSMDFESRAYAAWVDGKMLANETQEQLWGRTRPQLYHWRKMAQITHARNFGQTPVVEDRRIPDTAYSTTITVDGALMPGVRWQRPNTYHTTEMYREHPHRGQGHKIRKAVNAILSMFQRTLAECGESYPARSQYWQSPKALKQSLRRHERDDWHSDYVYRRNTRDGRVIWELMQPGQWIPITGCRIGE